MATKTPNVKSAFKKITGAKPPATAADAAKGKPAPGTAAPAAEKKKATKAEPPKEAVSLIDAKPKKTRDAKTAALENKPFSGLPTISKILSPEPPKAPEPEPAPAEPAAEAPVEGEAKSDEKVIHIKPPIIVNELAANMGL
jgi:translation initiation factor IF-2